MKSNVEQIKQQISRRVADENKRIARIVEEEVKSRTPVKTGNLRNSIRAHATEDSVTVGSDLDYAPYVEYGTIHMQAQPFLEPGVMAAKSRIQRGG